MNIASVRICGIEHSPICPSPALLGWLAPLRTCVRLEREVEYEVVVHANDNFFPLIDASVRSDVIDAWPHSLAAVCRG